MPKACKNIQESWTALESAFGNPRTLLNYRLKKVRSMPGLTDTLLQADPGFTATLYLDFGAAVEDIYDLGTKRASLEHTCFNAETITIITDKLPFSDSYLLSDSNLEGKAHLKEIINLIKKRKASAQKRASNKYNSDIKTSTTNALHTQAAITNLSGPSTTPRFEELRSRFESWADICSGTERTYPSYYDMQNLVSYTRQPKRYQVSPSGTTNNDCRICKILDTTGDHEGSLYVGHYGNYPTHCPRWAKMDQKERHRITQKAGFCHRCLNPTFTFKAGPELQTHHLTVCYVSKTNKNKYSCLNKD